MGDFPYLKAVFRILLQKGARLRIKSMYGMRDARCEMRDAEYSHRDYGMERKFVSG